MCYIGMTGFEPAASRPPAERSSQTEPHPEDVLFLQNIYIISHLPEKEKTF